jgi:hypothetical protein
MIQEINKLIESGALENALEIVNEEIMKSSNLDTDNYHELLFAKARIYIIKFKDTHPLNNSLFDQAKENFAQGDNAYKALHGKQHPDYQTAINTANKIYTELNQCKQTQDKTTNR